MQGVFHFLDGTGGDAFFGFWLLLLFEASLVLGLIGEVSFAFETAGGEPGEGVEHTQEIERVEFDGFAKRIGADFGDCVANEGGGDFMGGLEGVDASLLAGEVQSELETKS
jgi:hypothetical protein